MLARTMKFRIDPELQYCPQCQDEYRAGMVSCAACGVALLSGRQMLEIMEKKNNRAAGRSMKIGEEEQLVDILKGQIINIKQVQFYLEREGFSSIIAGDGKSCGKGCCGGSEVMLRVRAAEVREVMEVLAREHMQSTGLLEHDTSYIDSVYDTEAGEATCPACGCSFSTQNRTCPDCGLCF